MHLSGIIEKQSRGAVSDSADTVTLGKLLQQQGYVTGAFGKWGLGGPNSDGRPLKQGINRFFGYNCQAVAHNFYPVSLWDDETPYPLDNPSFSALQPRLADDVDPHDPQSYAGFTGKVYSADVITEQALKFVRDHAASRSSSMSRQRFRIWRCRRRKTPCRNTPGRFRTTRPMSVATGTCPIALREPRMPPW